MRFFKCVLILRGVDVRLIRLKIDSVRLEEHVSTIKFSPFCFFLAAFAVPHLYLYYSNQFKWYKQKGYDQIGWINPPVIKLQGYFNKVYKSFKVDDAEVQLVVKCSIFIMERSENLLLLDRQICNYHLRNNYSKKDNLYCYQPDRTQIANFYSSMADHFYQRNLRSPQISPTRNRKLKIRSQTQQALRDPMLACLPHSIPQDNLIAPGHAAATMNRTPMFSQVEASKKQKYVIAKEVRDLLSHDIKQMQSEKEEAAFRRRFPSKQVNSRVPKLQEQDTQLMIKQFNRLLIKYKNSSLNIQTQMGLLQKENQPCFNPDTSADQQFKILNIFKRLYLQTKSQDINQQLINYLLKFHYNDKITKKLRKKLTKPNTHTQDKRDSKLKVSITPTDTLKASKATSQASMTGNIEQSKKSPVKHSQFKPKQLPIKKLTIQMKDPKKLRSRTTHQLKLQGQPQERAF